MTDKRKLPEPNPLGFSMGDLLLVGGVAWFLLSESGQNLLRMVSPPKEGDTPPIGGGGAPSTQFTINNVGFPGYLIPGQSLGLDLTVGHIGKAAPYRVQFSISPSSFIPFIYTEPVWFMDMVFETNVDYNWESYPLHLEGVPGVGVGVYSTLIRIGDARGVKQAERRGLSDLMII